MPIKRTSNRQQIKVWVDKRIDEFLFRIIGRLQYIGLNVISFARSPERPRYTDQTGNLTSSIGYAIIRDGKVVHEDIEATAGTTDGSAGVSAARLLVKETSSELTKGIQLVLFAGMPYAVYVEAKGYDVLDSAIIEATREIKEKFKDVIK